VNTYEDVLKLLLDNKMLSKYHISKLGLFGSILNTDEPNDIDILIEGYEDYRDLIKFQDELEEKTGKSVDLVIEKFASPIILHRAKLDIQYVS